MSENRKPVGSFERMDGMLKIGRERRYFKAETLKLHPEILWNGGLRKAWAEILATIKTGDRIVE